METVNSCTSNCTRLGFFEQDWSNEAPWEILSNYFDYHPWLFSMLGSAIVGLSGVFPLLVIPNIDDQAAKYNNGDGGKTLKILLSFAVGGLLGDVFLHLLPEAWENHSAANREKNTSGVNHGSMGCGLWVLCGFLVFIIAEKIFSSCQDSDEDEPVSSEIELSAAENNNYSEADLKYDLVSNQVMKLNGFKQDQQLSGLRNLKKNGLINGEVTKINGLKKDQQLNGLQNSNVKMNGIINGKVTKLNSTQKDQQLNGFNKLSNSLNGANGYVNGFSKINGVKRKSNGFSTLDSSNAQEQQQQQQQLRENEVVEKPTIEKSKKITGYLNLVANCVDNFTHGLAVGGSFLVSFRLGALTTLAILIHEIPHEIGDFAILLKSGFTRWDAAKAQLMTATGGICGALFAIMFSGDAIESKTSWILPFTAGGFLHIGLVTVLPELLKETNPRESIKQIGALLIGIGVMAFLTIICD